MAISGASGAHETIDVSSEGLADGARRASQSRGFDFVFVNGKIAIDNNKLTDTRAGRPLKNQ